MGMKNFLFFAFVIVGASAQIFKVCFPTGTDTCQALDKGGSEVVCAPIESKIDCALMLESGKADFGVFTEEELLLLDQIQPNQHKVLASIRNINRQDPYAFESVAIVTSQHVGGLAGLKGGKYCHPGLDAEDIRWSPRVLKAFESAVTGSTGCPTASGKTAEELELENLSQFFAAACRPGDWSKNATLNTSLKSRHNKLCSLCAPNSCDSYLVDIDGQVQIAGVNRNNRHIQALECLRQNGNGTVAYVAWQHVKEYFTTITAPTSYSVLCPDGGLRPLTNEALAASTSPCAFIRQPYPAIVASSASAVALQAKLPVWWPKGTAPVGSSWQSALFGALVGGSNAKAVPEALPTPSEYVKKARTITPVDVSTSCLAPVRWCVSSPNENIKCQWLRAASHVLGLQPPITCTLRTTVLECLRDIKDNRADVVVASSNYGFMARQHFKLSPVKIVQNSRANPTAFSRIAALVKEGSSAAEVTRFENLRDKNACFPEFGGIAFVSFVRTAHTLNVISPSQCDYAKSVSEFFSGACAPGAHDAAHAMSDRSNVDSDKLCSMCRPLVQVVGFNNNGTTCAYDHTNVYYGNNGSLNCLADSRTHVAFVEIQNIKAELASLNLDPTRFRALCRNNTLARSAGVDIIDDGCLLSFVVDAELLTRRNDPVYNSLSTLLDTIDAYFGYTVAGGRLIDLKIYSPFNGIKNLLFKDSANGLSEPSNVAENEPARSYMELFAHLNTCTNSALGLASRSMFSAVTIILTALFANFVIY